MFSCNYCKRVYKVKGRLENHLRVCQTKKEEDYKNLQEQKQQRLSALFNKVLNEITIDKRDDIVRQLCMRIAELQIKLEDTTMKLEEHEESIASDLLREYSGY